MQCAFAPFRLIRDFCRNEGIELLFCKQAVLFREDMSPELARRCCFHFHGVGPRANLETFARLACIIDSLAAPGHVIDCNAAVGGRSEYLSDYVHLTAAGAEAVGRCILEGLRPSLRVRTAELSGSRTQTAPIERRP